MSRVFIGSGHVYSLDHRDYLKQVLGILCATRAVELISYGPPERIL